MADDQAQSNSGVQDDGSSARRSESGNRSKDGISNDQLVHDLISVEACHQRPCHQRIFNTSWEKIFFDLLSPYLSRGLV